MLMRPIAAGVWSLKETFDGTYIVDDLFDILEVLDVQLENKVRRHDWIEANKKHV